MIKQLRKKFIATNMLLVSLVLLAVFSALLVSNSRQLAHQSESAMRAALMWADGGLPPRLEILPRTAPEGDEESRPLPDLPVQGAGAGPQQGFTMVPVFSVTLNEDLSIRSVNQGNNISVDEDVLHDAVAEVLAGGEKSGVLRSLDLRYLIEGRPNSTTRIAFADRSWEQSSMRQLLLTCLLVALLGLGGFFLISLLLANLSLRPVEKAWQQQRQFVADASHELKTPLTVILANTGIVMAHPSDTVAEQSKWIGYIQEEARRMKALVDDMLFLAKSDAARLPSHSAQVRLDQLVTGSLLPFESVAFEAGVTLSEEVAPGLTVQGDEAQLRRLVVILLDNAVKYAGAQGSVTVRLEEFQGRPRLSVHNTGPAIPSERLPHLFERFYRADSARDRSQGGYGLGLAIAKSIAEGHGGKISVSSAPGEGTTFTVLFPKK